MQRGRDAGKSGKLKDESGKMLARGRKKCSVFSDQYSDWDAGARAGKRGFKGSKGSRVQEEKLKAEK